MFQFLNTRANGITSAAVIIALATFVSAILGILRDRILAGLFGAGSELDIYYAAFRIPDFAFNILGLGALSAALIPVFLKVKQEATEQGGWLLINQLLNTVILGLVALCSILWILTPHLTTLIVPGFNAGQQALTMQLTRLMLLSPFFLGLSSVFGGILQSFRRFAIFAIAPIFYNLGIIFGAIFLTKNWGLHGLALGVIIGAFLHFLIQYWGSRQLGFAYRAISDFKNQYLRQIFRLMVPRIFGLATTQINFLAITVIASLLAEGSLAIFNLANNLQGFPISLFAMSFAIAAFPLLAENASRGERGEFVKNLSSTTRQILFFIVPASVLLLMLRAQIVRIVLGSGHFDWEDTIFTADTLALFSFSLFAQALLPLLSRAFYALQNTKTPFYAGLFSVIVNIILALFFGRSLGVAGLGLAFSLAAMLNLLLLWFLLRMRIGQLDDWQIFKTILRFFVAAIGMAGTIQVLKGVMAPLVNMQTFVGVFGQGLVAGLAGLLIFAVICFLLRSPEMLTFFRVLKGKILKLTGLFWIGE